MSTKERRKREKQQRRETIINATIEILDREGFTGISMDKIAENAELSKGALYLYFKNKEQLIIEILSMKFDDFLNRLESAMTFKGDFESIVKKVIQTAIDFLSENVDLFRFLHSSFPGESPDIAKNIDKYMKEFRKKSLVISNRFYKRFLEDKYYVTPNQMRITLSGLISGFLLEKFFGDTDEEPDADLICKLFFKGISK